MYLIITIMQIIRDITGRDVTFGSITLCAND